LGSIALRSQDYPKAYRILQESIKADYDNWNVWDNYQNACQKVKDFEEEIKACYRLLELRGKVNVDSLGLLVAAVVEGLTDIRGASALRLLPKVKELFGAMAAKLADNSKLWFLYAKLNMAELGEQNSNRRDLLLTIVQKLQRAFRYATKEKDWEKEEISLVNVLSIAKELGTHQMLLVQAESDDAEQRSVRSSCRLMLDSVITKVEKSCSDFVTGHLLLTEDSAKIFDEIRLMKSGL
jgi:tetratricopeptide (TPR) repeat protein